MTTFRNYDKKCAVCTKTSPQTVIRSTSTWGHPDLDLRPSGMKRNSMFAWLQECPHCGYVAVKIEKELNLSADFLKSNEYRTCDGYEFKTDLAKKFYRYYLLSKAKGDYRSQFFSLMRCAWACDDADDDLAVEMRKMSLKSINKFNARSDDEKINLKFIKADLLRRSLQFDKLIHEFKDTTFEDKLKNDAIAFQLELAEKKDSSRYTVEDIPKRVTITVKGDLLKKLKQIGYVKNVSLLEVIETMIKEKADETDLNKLIDELMGIKK